MMFGNCSINLTTIQLLELIKWMFRNKADEHWIIVRNKFRLVAKEYNQEEAIDYEETFVQVVILESIRMFLAYVCHANFTLFQMDVFLMEEVNVKLRCECRLVKPR